MFLEADKAQLVVMTIVCLQNFLRSSPDSAAICTPPDFGRVTEGSCRAMSNENMTYLFPLKRITHKRTLKAK
jgi:hypothetical protein